MQSIRRLEYKYFVPYEGLDPLRRRFLINMQHDAFARTMEQFRYTVRSIYLDTPRFLFYQEKIQGVKNRKKLRVRTYNTPIPDAVAFLEIKRKYTNVICKDRVSTSLSDVPRFLDEGECAPLLKEDHTPLDVEALQKFALYVNKLNLRPVVLVSYEREALEGLDDKRLRVTFDLNVRSYPYPDLDEIYREDDMNTINDRCFILEIKFDEWMPWWVRRIVSDFNLRQQPLSKYCEGLDRWLTL